MSQDPGFYQPLTMPHPTNCHVHQAARTTSTLCRQALVCMQEVQENTQVANS